MTLQPASPRADQYDVAIVGFGPVGATLAGLLGKRGWKVVVFDKSKDIFPLPRAVGLDHEVMRIFQAFGDLDELRLHTAPYQPTVYLGCDRQPILRFDVGPPPFPLGWRPNYTFNQPGLEAWLRESVTRLPTVNVRLGVEVTKLQGASEEAVLWLNDDSHSPVRAKFAVGCDGAASLVRRTLGTRLEDLEFDERWLVIDMILSKAAQSRLPDTNIQYCRPERPSTYVVLPGNHRRWEIMTHDGERPEELLEPAKLWQLLADWIIPQDGQLWRAAAYRFHAVVAERWRSGRIFVAGDSAHQMPPFLAQGMCQGIRDAANLEWKLDLILKGNGSDKLLDSYESERKMNVMEVTRAVKQLGKLICERDPVAARRRDAEVLESQGGVVKTKARQDLIPGIKTGIISPAGSSSGTVFPQPLICVAGQEPLMLDDLTGPKFRLVVNCEQNISVDLSENSFLRVYDAAVIEAHNNGNVCIDGVVRGADSNRQLSKWFEKHKCAAAVVRPDGYVFGTAATRDRIPALLIELTSHILGE